MKKKKQTKLKETVIAILIILYLFILLTQVYVAYTITGMATVQGNIGVTLLPSCNLIFDGQKNIDNHSVDLNWTGISGILSYNIYYSSNISAIMNLNLNNISSDVYNFSNITALNYTDNTTSQVQKRYYRVSCVASGSEQLSLSRAIGKFTYYYTTPQSITYGPLASNRIVLYLNVNYTAESFMQSMPNSLLPTISRLDKSNPSGEYLTTHVKGLLDGNDFQMNAGYSYQVSINDYFNQTVVGRVYIPPYVLNYDVPNSTTYGPLASNWRGVFDFKKNYTAESFLQEIPVGLNPTISRLDKTNASGEYLTTHVRGLNDGNNFSVLIGTGYVITVDNYYNHTLCSSDGTCFS